MIIDGRGHYTTSPRQHEGWRPQQIEAHTAGKPPPPRPTLTDDEIRETIVGGQLKVQRERGTDLTTFRRAPPAWTTTSATQQPVKPGSAPATN
jgi:4-oxalmesaconate hydratase